MSEISVNGMVISSMPMGEYDRRIEILTAEWGRIGAFARGARKPSSELVSVSRVFAFGKFELFQGKNSYTVKSAKISNYFTELSSDIETMYYGFYFLELCRYFSHENIEAGDMLKLTYAALRALGRGTIPKGLIRSIFELKMLGVNGVAPEPEEGMQSAAAYAIRYVLSTAPEKVFSFNLSQEALEPFQVAVDFLMAANVDKKFKSLEFLK